ncbi:unnamed protein product [Sphagnum troendelagicum]
MLLSLFLLLRIWIFCRDSWASPTEAEKLRTLDSSGGDDQKRGGYSDVFLLRDIVISFLLAGRDTSSSELSESPRLYPPLPVDTKFAVKEDVLPDGTHIPKASIVAYASYAMGRMEQLWGSDCLEFKPERWLQNGVFVPQCPYKYAVFQAGPRICLGKDLALLQIKLVTAGLINCFDFDVPEDFKPTYEISLLLPMKYGLPTKISPSKRES